MFKYILAIPCLSKSTLATLMAAYLLRWSVVLSMLLLGGGEPDAHLFSGHSIPNVPGGGLMFDHHSQICYV